MNMDKNYLQSNEKSTLIPVSEWNVHKHILAIHRSLLSSRYTQTSRCYEWKSVPCPQLYKNGGASNLMCPCARSATQLPVQISQTCTPPTILACYLEILQQR
ncbi:hypothetical protein Syun_018833 [Stephania yunnanensis]|uniref:Uncharacterized protein n=1 Tax=Stephania yunnanensis TaxID=152371 RepID=A0AAP0IVB7_9MAGN